MTAPTRTSKTASRAGTTQREQDSPESQETSRTARSSETTKAAPTKAAPTKAAPTKSAPKPGATKARTRSGSGAPAKPRSTAAERAYARREERRSVQEDGERRPRTQRQTVDEPLPQRQRAAQPKAKPLPSKVAASRVPLVVAGMSMLASGLVATLWLSIAAVSGSYELQQAETEVNALNEHKELLMRQVSSMDSTPALQRRAAELGLVPAPEPAHLVQHPDGSTTVVGEPKAAKRSDAVRPHAPVTPPPAQAPVAPSQAQAPVAPQPPQAQAPVAPAPPPEAR